MNYVLLPQPTQTALLQFLTTKPHVYAEVAGLIEQLARCQNVPQPQEVTGTPPAARPMPPKE
jgi:hypothetical protein